MQQHYAIPPDAAPHLGVGNWVEIFEAYGNADGTGAIRVISMRIGGEMLNFPEAKRKKNIVKPHEGEVVFIDRGATAIHFKIRLRS